MWGPVDVPGWPTAAIGEFPSNPIGPITPHSAPGPATISRGLLTVDIETDDGKTVYAHRHVNNISRFWQRYDVDLKTDKDVTPSTENRFVISTTSKGTFWITEASLFPPTFNNRPNGNRIDLMQKLADLMPSFIIFPGGDSLNGRIVRTRFNWKNTIGPVETRSAQVFSVEGTSNGFGLMEFLPDLPRPAR